MCVCVCGRADGRACIWSDISFKWYKLRLEFAIILICSNTYLPVWISYKKRNDTFPIKGCSGLKQQNLWFMNSTYTFNEVIFEKRESKNSTGGTQLFPHFKWGNSYNYMLSFLYFFAPCQTLGISSLKIQFLYVNMNKSRFAK